MELDIKVQTTEIKEEEEEYSCIQKDETVIKAGFELFGF
jgi:hypothetical protein